LFSIASLSAKSPGMLPDGADPFHTYDGILVDDQGHPHDLPQITEEVFASINAEVPDDIRRLVQREFFAFHLQRYSKSRRKAPIYWPLSTTSGSYTLWIYYPSLTSQTLYTAINDFVEPKLKQVGAAITTINIKTSARTRDEEKQLEALQTFELELIELRDTLLTLARTYKPIHDDGVQISAAPLWPLFRHKPWQKVLKDTWAKLEKGDYDWAHLAMNYWPERVRKKCKTDKSLAIAHGLEHLFIEPEAKPKKTRGQKKVGGDE
ncbi:MAG: type II restriction endonuclease subunit M, partial [Clostridia bacterium]|nr:type II restriction endonuclease subunit M [Clostridia bacterium]